MNIKIKRMNSFSPEVRSNNTNLFGTFTQTLFTDFCLKEDSFWGLYLYKEVSATWQIYYFEVTDKNLILFLTSKVEVLRDLATKWTEKYGN